MQTDFTTNLISWAISLLAYPGFIFALLLALTSEWLASIFRPLFIPRLYRGKSRPASFLDPLAAILKLMSRKDAVHWQAPTPSASSPNSVPSHHAESALSVIGAVAPILALALMPVAANPVTQSLGLQPDLLLVLALLAVYPIASAAAQARSGGLSVLSGAQTIGALLTGLVPALLVIAALVQVSGSHTLNLPSLLAAPETPQQTFVRLLGGIALIIALPWWQGRRPTQNQSAPTSAGTQAGKLFQTSALAVFWSVLILPAAGNQTWAIVISVVGSLFAALTMRLVGDRWLPTRRTAEAANLVWAATFPLCLAAIALSLFS